MVLRSQPTIPSLISMSVLPRLIARFGTIALWIVWGRLSSDLSGRSGPFRSWRPARSGADGSKSMVWIFASQTREVRERPQEYGVSVLQGAFALWNLQSDEKVAISADLVNLSAG